MSSQLSLPAPRTRSPALAALPDCALLVVQVLQEHVSCVLGSSMEIRIHRI